MYRHRIAGLREDREHWIPPRPSSRRSSPPLSIRRATIPPPIPAPRVLTYTTRDVIDQRISIPAQHALVRLSKNPATSREAVRILAEIKAGRLAGLYCVNWQLAAQRALQLGTNWWTAIPEGHDGVLILDPMNLLAGPPLIAFRRNLDPDCGLLAGERRFAARAERLDAALLRAWQTYLGFRRGDLAPCPPGFRDVRRRDLVAGEPAVPELCRAFRRLPVCSVRPEGGMRTRWTLASHNRQPASCSIVHDAILTEPDRDWLAWAGQWAASVKPLTPPRQSVSVPQKRSRGVQDVFAVYSDAIQKAQCGHLIVSVGHGGAATTHGQQDFFELWPRRLWPWNDPGNPLADHKITEDFLLYLGSSQYGSEFVQYMTKHPQTPLAVRRRVEKADLFRAIGTALKSAEVRELVLLTCRVGQSTGKFLDDLARAWHVSVRAWTQRVWVRQLKSGGRFQAGLRDDQGLDYTDPRYQTELPRSTCKPSPTGMTGPICTDQTVVRQPNP